MTTPTPTMRDVRQALILAAAAGKRKQWWAAERAAAAFDAERAKKTQPKLEFDAEGKR